MWRWTWLLSDSMRIDSCKSWPYYLAWEIADRYFLAFSFSWFTPCRSWLQWRLYCWGPTVVRTSCLIGNGKLTSALPPPPKKRCFFKCQLRKRFLRASWLRQATTTATSTRTAKIKIKIGKTTTLHVHRAFVHFFAVTARLRRETS